MIQAQATLGFRAGHTGFARALARDAAYGVRRGEQRVGRQGIRVRECCFFTRDGTHAHTLTNRETPCFNDTLFETPALAARVLKVQVRVVDFVGKYFTEGTIDIRLTQAPRIQQQ